MKSNLEVQKSFRSNFSVNRLQHQAFNGTARFQNALAGLFGHKQCSAKRPPLEAYAQNDFGGRTAISRNSESGCVHIILIFGICKLIQSGIDNLKTNKVTNVKC